MPEFTPEELAARIVDLGLAEMSDVEAARSEMGAGESTTLDFVKILHGKGILTNLQLDKGYGDNIDEKMGVLLSKFCGPSLQLRTLHLEQKCFSMQRPLNERHIQSIFRSQTLQHLTIRNMNLNCSELRVVAEELSRNVALESVDLRGDACESAAGYLDLLKTMQSQYYVKRFQIFSPMELEFIDEPCCQDTDRKKGIATEIEAFAALNVAKRRHIMEDKQSSREDWASLLLVGRESVNAVYSLLLAYPDVCDRSRYVDRLS